MWLDESAGVEDRVGLSWRLHTKFPQGEDEKEKFTVKKYIFQIFFWK